MPIDEGYIKFNIQWTEGDAPSHRDLHHLISARNKLFKHGLIGELEGGIGFGNVSLRSGPGTFIISGTQTGGIEKAGPEHFTHVTYSSIASNEVHCVGPLKASSESLTHAAIYALDDYINAVVHVHHAGIWNMYKDRIPTTAADIAYGTPEMAQAVEKLYEEGNLSTQKTLIMAGHEDGVISFGQDMDSAYQIMMLLHETVNF